ncbi:MAG: hypothetical protein AAF547_08725 [Actinomycetota bacterium]
MDLRDADTGDRLSVDAAEETHRLEPGETLTFGRAATAVLDPDNPYMHRVVGRLVFDRWSWWLHNTARHVPLTMVGDDDRLKTLPAGTAEPLTTATGKIRFYAGAQGYELAWELDGRPPGPDLAIGVEDLDDVTADFGNVVLSVDQRRMLTAMAEPDLRDPGRPTRLPPNAEIAARFGWTLKQFDRKLDYLCRKLTEGGVPGLRGRPGTEAADRRVRLVRHVLHHGLITGEDLRLLDDGRPRSEEWAS